MLDVEGDIVDMDWYVIHTYSGFEQKVRTSLIEQFERSE